jgi:hypothetical protein
MLFKLLTSLHQTGIFQITFLEEKHLWKFEFKKLLRLANDYNEIVTAMTQKKKRRRGNDQKKKKRKDVLYSIEHVKGSKYQCSLSLKGNHVSIRICTCGASIPVLGILV